MGGEHESRTPASPEKEDSMNSTNRGRGRVPAQDYVTVQLLPEFATQMISLLSRTIESLSDERDREGLELLRQAIHAGFIAWVRR